MKHLSNLLLITSISFLVGCGGGSSDTSVDPMTERDAVIIFYHMPTGECANPEFQNYLKDEIATQGFVVDYWLFREESLNVTCSTYGKTNDFDDNGGCMTLDLVLADPSLEVYKTSCVIGFDADINSQPTFSQVNNIKDISSAINTSATIW